MTSTSITLRRQKFVSEYVETGNATHAATVAGYSRSGARVAGVLRTWQHGTAQRSSLIVQCVSQFVASGLRGWWRARWGHPDRRYWIGKLEGDGTRAWIFRARFHLF